MLRRAPVSASFALSAAFAAITMSCAEQPVAGPPTTGPELLARSIQYHDPGGVWAQFRHTLVIRQEGPNGDARRAKVRLEVPTAGFVTRKTRPMAPWSRASWTRAASLPSTAPNPRRNEAAGDGEYILLRESRDVLGMKLPVIRRWFTNQDSTYLGADHLVEDFQGQPVGAHRSGQP